MDPTAIADVVRRVGEAQAAAGQRGDPVQYSFYSEVLRHLQGPLLSQGYGPAPARMRDPAFQQLMRQNEGPRAAEQARLWERRTANGGNVVPQANLEEEIAARRAAIYGF